MKQKKCNYLVIVKIANPSMFSSLSEISTPRTKEDKTFYITKISIKKLTL